MSIKCFIFVFYDSIIWKKNYIRKAKIHQTTTNRSNEEKLLINLFPENHKARWFVGASLSRKLSVVAIIQLLAQLEKNYDKSEAEIIVDNCQLYIFFGFDPNSKTAEVLSKNLGNKTIISGTVSEYKGDSAQSLQMIE